MLTRGIAASFKLMGTVKPGAVVGFGGYPAFPPLVAARLRNIPTALHEQNAVLGRANRALAKHVTAVATSFENTKLLDGRALARSRVTGNPVRDQVVDWATQSYQPPHRGGPFSLLVFGGSQGARYFADAVPPAVALLPDEIKASLFVVQQCREEDLKRVEAAYEAANVRAHLATFFANLPDEMAKAHLVIGRSGASTVAELAVMGRPAILVPLPHAIDNDQLQNARRLAELGGAWCMEQKDLTPEHPGPGHRPPARIARDPDAGGNGRQGPRPARRGQPPCRSRRGADRPAAAKRVKFGDRAGYARPARERRRMQMPLNIGPVHILGIGGIGMSAIAEIMHAKGYTVQGSDQKESANVKRLRAKGIRVFVGHDPINLVGARYVVISTAVKTGNPELEAARAKGLPIIRRAEMLAELMRLYATVSVTGTHGKTTTTSLIAHVFNAGGLDPTVITGGIINDWGSNARRGEGPWMIVEADESDGTFIKIPTQIGVVTNIDPEHLDYFKTVDNMHREFEAFFRNIPFYGLAVACIDHPVVSDMIERLELQARRPQAAHLRRRQDRRPGAEIRARRWRQDRVRCRPQPARDGRPAHAARLDRAAARPSQRAQCAGGDRRGERGRHRRRRDPHGHGQLLRRQAPLPAHRHLERRRHLRRLWPSPRGDRRGAEGRPRRRARPRHRRGRAASLHARARPVRRVRRLLQGCRHASSSRRCIRRAKLPIDGVDHVSLAEAIRTTGHRSVATVDSERDLAPMLRRFAARGDMVICLGAGNSTEWAYALPDWLAAEPMRVGGAL